MHLVNSDCRVLYVVVPVDRLQMAHSLLRRNFSVTCYQRGTLACLLWLSCDILPEQFVAVVTVVVVSQCLLVPSRSWKVLECVNCLGCT